MIFFFSDGVPPEKCHYRLGRRPSKIALSIDTPACFLIDRNCTCHSYRTLLIANFNCIVIVIGFSIIKKIKLDGYLITYIEEEKNTEEKSRLETACVHLC